MYASATPRKQPRRSRHAALVTVVAPLMFAAGAWSQLPTPAPRSPAVPAQNSQTLLAAQPTKNHPPAVPQPAPASHSYRARVEFADNQLMIAAENSSLDEILGDIARLTGMKITGGLTDERVYGSYGPDSAQVVLNQLLDGTGTNVVLLETPQHTLAELVLTPRNGGPTPPSPHASRDDDRNEENLPPGLGGRRRDLQPGGRRGQVEGNLYPENHPSEQPQPALQPATPPTSGDPAAAQPDASQQPPNGGKTPQQIYEDLVKQQAQQQQQTPTIPPQ